MYAVTFVPSAFEDLEYLPKRSQRSILDAIERQLSYEPLTETRNRKPLQPNVLSSWELRVGKNRVFYDVSETDSTVTICAVGYKEHNTLYIRGREFEL